jgi:hypothetical protein
MVKYCSRCGKQAADDAAFCSSCGASFAAVTAPQQPQAGRRPTRVSVISILNILGGIGMLILGVALFFIPRTVVQIPIPSPLFQAWLGLALAFSAFGLWKMKRWAYHVWMFVIITGWVNGISYLLAVREIPLLLISGAISLAIGMVFGIIFILLIRGVRDRFV